MQVASEAKVIAQQTRSNLQMRFEMLEMGVPPLPPPPYPAVHDDIL
jgi:hypothetical protein